jgi:hemoglobin
MSRVKPLVLLLVGAVALGVGCQTDSSDTAVKTTGAAAAGTAAGATLWSRLGGEPAVRAVVHDFVDRGAKNPKVNFTRVGKPNEWKPTPQDINTLEQRLVEFISENTGGPIKYKGEDMVTAHKGMQITNSEFDALAADLAASLDKFKVPKKEKDELIAVVASTRGQIVNK